MHALAGRSVANPGSAALFRPHKGNPRFPKLFACGLCGGRHRAFGSQRAGHRSQSAALGRTARARPPRRRAQRALRLHGSVHRRPGAALLYRLHGARQGCDALLLDHARLHRRLHRPGLQRQPVHLLSLLGIGRPLLVHPGRLLVHQPRSRERRAQGAADDAHRRLRPARRNSGALSPHRQCLVDRSCRGAQLHQRAFSRSCSWRWSPRASRFRCTRGFPRPWPRPLR